MVCEICGAESCPGLIDVIDCPLYGNLSGQIRGNSEDKNKIVLTHYVNTLTVFAYSVHKNYLLKLQKRFGDSLSWSSNEPEKERKITNFLRKIFQVPPMYKLDCIESDGPDTICVQFIWDNEGKTDKQETIITTIKLEN